LIEVLKESRLSAEDTLTTIVLAFLSKLYQHPNIDFLLEEEQKLFAELKIYEADMELKFKAMEQAVASYLEKANNFIGGDRVLRHSEDIIHSGPSNFPSVSEFRYAPSEALVEQRGQTTMLPEILEENRHESNIEMTGVSELARYLKPPNTETL